MSDNGDYIMYISGAITNDPGYMEKFAKAEAYLKLRGYRVVNPAKVSAQLPKLEHWQYMKVCLAMLDLADGIWLLSDWQQSEGAKEEYLFIIMKNAEIESKMPMVCRPFVEIWEDGRLTMERTAHNRGVSVKAKSRHRRRLRIISDSDGWVNQ